MLIFVVLCCERRSKDVFVLWYSSSLCSWSSSSLCFSSCCLALVCCVVKGREFLLCVHNIHIDWTPMLPLPLCECADSISHRTLKMHVQCLVKPFVWMKSKFACINIFLDLFFCFTTSLQPKMDLHFLHLNTPYTFTLTQSVSPKPYTHTTLIWYLFLQKLW
jgi:hypothetical protein